MSSGSRPIWLAYGWGPLQILGAFESRHAARTEVIAHYNALNPDSNTWDADADEVYSPVGWFAFRQHCVDTKQSGYDVVTFESPA